MIRLFLADIDGCLSEPYVPFDLDGFRRLRDWGLRAETDDRVPRLGLCSGRSYAYVEAMAQALGLRAPALFESGGGRFDLADARITWNPALTPGTEAALARGMEAVRVGGATAARPHGGIHISEFLRRHEGPAGVAAGARVPADAVRRMLESLQNPDGSVDAGQLVARIVEMSREGGDTCEYRMDDGNDGDY